jgi:hypothetical protein
MELRVKRSRDRQNILILLHDDNPADNLACPIQIGSSPAKVIATLNVTNVSQVNRFLGFVTTNDKIFQPVDVPVADNSA